MSAASVTVLTKCEFPISQTFKDRLWAIREIQGKTNKTFDDFAREILENSLYLMFPVRPLFDEGGRLMNPEEYMGELQAARAKLRRRNFERGFSAGNGEYPEI